MTDYQYNRTKAQLGVLKELQGSYGGRTLDNIIQNFESIIAYEDERREKEHT